MAVVLIIPLLLVAASTSCKSEHTNGFGIDGNNAGRFGDLLKPPPPPLSQIVPVPFHGGANRPQRQNLGVGYHYPPPSSSLQSIPQSVPSNDFKFPAPFYKQYNFNFVPPPQPFLTTPSPSLFQKVSTWLFPSQQTSYEATLTNNNLGPVKKDCNPCNLVPWIPVIKYNNVGNKIVQNPVPTYGLPSPTAFANVQSVIQYHPHPFQTQIDEKIPPHLTPGTPAANYGPPALPVQNPTVSSVEAISSTYGPPSPTHTLELNTQRPHSSTFSLPLSTYGLPSHTYGIPNKFINQQSTSYLPGLPNGILNTNFIDSSTYKTPTSYASPSPPFLSPSPSYGTPYSVTTYVSVTPPYEPKDPERESPPQNDVEILRDNIEPLDDLQLPKVNHPTRFKNSYGEPIINTNIFDIPYPVTATAAESTKIRTEVLPGATYKRPSTPNVSLALSNPAPFTLNRGRNIHTLQPVALPNLSVSPLPPIFNARPFRPVTPFSSNVVNGINHMQHVSNNVNIAQSVPLVEFTHSIDYPATYIQAPVIDIDSSKPVNQSKSYRNIPNNFVIDEVKDISSQASEDHISATKTGSGSDVSFESTGTDVGNDIYDPSVPTELKYNVHSNHKMSFSDLRGVKDEDVDKFRTESNLQTIDSPLLYLKPSAPHKGHGDFLLAVSTPVTNNEYEIYDDIPTTLAPLLPTINTWDESKTDYNEKLLPSAIQKDMYKPKIVQIIVPYTTGQKEVETNEDYSQGWAGLSEEEHQARKVPLNTDKPYTSTESYSVLTTTTESSVPSVTENYGTDQSNPTFNDFYDVKGPPFDIIKLQHTIDDWTEQEFSKDYKIPQRTRSSDKYAKQIPDEFFTTTVPTNYPTDPETFNDELYDHESASSIQHSVREEKNSTFNKAHKEYNIIERNRDRQNNNKNEVSNDVQKLHIYTAASSFRTTSSSTTTTTTTTTTTPAPWGKIQTSISPLTKEKVYVVTSKPWREAQNSSNDWYAVESFESKKTSDSDTIASDNLPFKSPRFINRPSFGFTSGGKIESVRSDTLFGFSKSWYQSINDLENQAQSTITPLIESPSQKDTNSDEV